MTPAAEPDSPGDAHAPGTGPIASAVQPVNISILSESRLPPRPANKRCPFWDSTCTPV